MNVLEHIEDDRSTLADFASVLPSGGHLVLLVPAMKALYGTLDQHLHSLPPLLHSTSYAAPSPQPGFEIDTLRFLNRPAGSRLVAELAGAQAPGDAQGSAQSLQVGHAAAASRGEDGTGFGLSLLVLARKA